MPKTIKPRPKADPRKAMAILRKIKLEGPESRFKGMSEEEVIRAIKRTREKIWKEKLASRP